MWLQRGNEVPDAVEVRRYLLVLLSNGEKSTLARKLCDTMVGDGWSRRSAQIGIQRAMDSGQVRVNDDWSIS